jgi:hypothetical protein
MIVSPEKVSPTFSSTDSLENQEKAVLPVSATLYEENDDVVFLHGEPIVTTGKDISRFVVDIRDDGDDALTFRSFVLGTVLAALGAALSQVRQFSIYIYIYVSSSIVPDIPVQTCTSGGFAGLFTANYLYFWERLGNMSAKEDFGRGNSVRNSGPDIWLHKSWCIYFERGMLHHVSEAVTGTCF